MVHKDKRLQQGSGSGSDAACVLWACCSPQLLAAGVLPSSEWATLLQHGWATAVVCTVCCGHGALARRPAPSEHAELESSFLPQGPAGCRPRGCAVLPDSPADGRGRPSFRRAPAGSEGPPNAAGCPVCDAAPSIPAWRARGLVVSASPSQRSQKHYEPWLAHLHLRRSLGVFWSSHSGEEGGHWALFMRLA